MGKIYIYNDPHFLQIYNIKMVIFYILQQKRAQNLQSTFTLTPPPIGGPFLCTFYRGPSCPILFINVLYSAKLCLREAFNFWGWSAFLNKLFIILINIELEFLAAKAVLYLRLSLTDSLTHRSKWPLKNKWPLKIKLRITQSIFKLDAPDLE